MAARSPLVLVSGQVATLGAGDTIAGDVSYAAAQSLTVAQRNQARGNVGLELSRADITSAVGGVVFSLPSGFSAFRLIFDGLLTSTNNDIVLVQFSADGGSTFYGSNGSTVYQYEVEILQGTSGPYLFYGAASSMNLHNAVNNANAWLGLSGEALIFPGSTTRAARLSSRAMAYQSAGSTPTSQRYTNDVYYNGALAMNALRILGNSGSLTAGSLRLIGEAT